MRGKLKRDEDVFVGDFVEYDKLNKVVISVYPRANRLIRPYVANVDILLIVVAPKPQPDWVLVEKLLLNCHSQRILPVLVVNKCDLLDENELENMIAPYRREVKTFSVSAKKGIGLDELRSFTSGKTVCLSGQSAVGKTSLINALGGYRLETGELSRKIDRGKNTTRQVEIFFIGDGKIVDTCGFSIVDGIDIKPQELIYYYDEFLAVQDKCRYSNCTHTNEPGCEVKRLVNDKRISESRYARYVKLYKELTERSKRRYD